jgi:hypothetical protein
LLGQLLDQIREYYLSRFMKAVASARQDPSVRVITEAALVDVHGTVVPEGELHLPLRNDLFVVTDGRVSDSQLIDTKETLSFKPVSFTWDGGLAVSLSAFQWNWLELRLHGLSGQPSWSPLEA